MPDDVREFPKVARDRLARILATDARLPALLSKAVAPFSFRIERSGSVCDLTGDKPTTVFVEHFLDRLAGVMSTKGAAPSADTFKTCIDQTLDEVLKHELALRLDGIFQPVRAHSMNQLGFLYDVLNRDHPLVFGIGPTGTGKTYLALVAALNQLAKDAVKHIVITKPHEMLRGEVMTAEKRAEKARDEQFEAYFDILGDLIGQDELQSLMDHRRLEITPLGLLRGRTLKGAFILVDEAQNTDKQWMRLAVTRAGEHSRMIITGDPSHSALPNGEVSGLSHLLGLIKDRDIGLVHEFQAGDIVRNDTVAQLEALYMQAGRSDVELGLSRP